MAEEPSKTMTPAWLEATPWDEQEQREIIDYIEMDYKGIIDFKLETTAIEEGLCFQAGNCMQPWRWTDNETGVRAVHVALSHTNVMYLQEKYAIHVLNPCPPCLCCVQGHYREDFAPKIRKLVPYEKITDVEVHEAGNNELVTPGCMCPPECNPRSVQVPFSKAFIQTAGTGGCELQIKGIKDANAFRRRVMDLKKGGGAVAILGGATAPAQQSMGAGLSAAAIGASSEMVALLKDIASSCQEMAESNRGILKALSEKSGA